MGWNTTIVLMNDALTDIKNDPKVGEAIHEAVLGLHRGGLRDISAGSSCNAMTAIEQHHADHLVAVAVGGNSGHILGPAGFYRATPEESLQELARARGYRLVKMPGKKPG